MALPEFLKARIITPIGLGVGDSVSVEGENGHRDTFRVVILREANTESRGVLVLQSEDDETRIIGTVPYDRRVRKI